MNKKSTQALIEKFSSQKIAVVGDVMLDRYIYGTASRISPEAPVPVVKVDREEYVLGGAANVQRNLSSLGATVFSFAICGNDQPADICDGLFNKWSINSDGIVKSETIETTLKTRVIAAGQQIVRIDREADHGTIEDSLRDQLLEKLKVLIKTTDLDAIIFEDYNKGVLSPALAAEIQSIADSSGIVTALDPHPANILNIKGLSLMTPNRKEAFHMTGEYYHPTHLPINDDNHLKAVVHKLTSNWGVEQLLITLGSDGMALYHNEDVYHIATKAKDVFDVSGAGDTVIATYVPCILAGASPDDAANIANAAAGVVVGKVGTYCISPNELLDCID
ncbi:MAG: D-glycero-beta-D-manno-heptose-7-phosphate kinase [Lentisphaeria bacterium]|nr:PfkB family carbohydrate kinase [Lentisphaeria bacterium]NQZ70857.1 D-glycero-beta-D-manno-heptose-7-phosphate kinase [Lentisphaeria bacterium]